MPRQNSWLRLASLAGGHNFDLVVVDFAMPGMDGIEVAKKLRAARPSLPIVMMTGYADAVRWSAPPMELHLLEKPFRLDQLASALRAVLETGISGNVVPLRPRPNL